MVFTDADDSSVTPAARHLPSPGKAKTRVLSSPYPSNQKQHNTKMTNQTKQFLFDKNTRIIEAVKARAAEVCPETLDMIAVTGSFASGDFHEKSDLDLLIVISDDAGYQLSHCFILDDVGYDLYCHTWERLEHAAEYDSPYVSKLLDAQIVYTRNDGVTERFSEIAARLQARLDAPLSAQDCERAMAEVALAKQSYFDLASSDGAGYYFPLIGVIYHLECAVYLLNHALVRHGVRGIPSELGVMTDLPDDFLALHGQAFGDLDFAQARTTAMTMIRNTERWVCARRAAVCQKQTPCDDNLRGTYEELISNYYNKLIYGADNGDRYLSRMTLGSAQLFFDEVGDAVALTRKIGFCDDAYRDGASAVNAFSEAMHVYACEYASVGLPVCNYTDINAFEDAYKHGK